MVIQCTSCQTKYRLNLERIPNRKTFVKCRSCGTPIYIDPPEDAMPELPVASPPSPGAPGYDRSPVPEPRESAPSGGESARIVACPNCDTRYHLPAAALNRPGAKVKCTRCSHVFAASAPAAAPDASEPPTWDAGPDDGRGGEREFYPPPGEREEPRSTRLERPMPIPDDSMVDDMFDDFRERDTPFAADSGRSGGTAKAPPAAMPDTDADVPEPDFSDMADETDSDSIAASIRDETGGDLSAGLGFQPQANEPDAIGADPYDDAPEPAASLFTADLEQMGDLSGDAPASRLHPSREEDPERAYLEAVALEGEVPKRPPRGTVPDDQKYRFFLKPGEEPPPQLAPPPGSRTSRPRASLESPPPPPAVRVPGPPPPLDREPDELDELNEMETSFEPVGIGGEEDIYPPPTHEPGSDFDTGAGLDLDEMAGALEADAELEEGLDVTDDVDLLLQQHGVAADAMDDPGMPDIIRTDPMAPVGETAPARPLVGEPFGRSPAMSRATGTLGRINRGMWLHRAINAGIVLAAVALHVIAFYLGYQMG